MSTLRSRHYITAVDINSREYPSLGTRQYPGMLDARGVRNNEVNPHPLFWARVRIRRTFLETSFRLRDHIPCPTGTIYPGPSRYYLYSFWPPWDSPGRDSVPTGLNGIVCTGPGHDGTRRETRQDFVYGTRPSRYPPGRDPATTDLNEIICAVSSANVSCAKRKYKANGAAAMISTCSSTPSSICIACQCVLFSLTRSVRPTTSSTTSVRAGFSTTTYTYQVLN